MNSKLLTIQDISCVGQCSITVALPIISACGIETCILPSAVLSTHTGGFTGFTFRDLTEDIPKIAEHWKKEGISFNTIYTGYLGSAKQIAYVLQLMKELSAPDCLHIVDPAMADNGRLYTGFDQAFVDEMKKLCYNADIILPNMTEACLITDTEYRSEYDPDFVDSLVRKMVDAGAKTIILTGVSYRPDTSGVLIYENGQSCHYEHKRIPGSNHGTGDVYASSFTGALLRGHSAVEAAKIAADFTLRCIENTQGDADHWYGVKFESVLPELIAKL